MAKIHSKSKASASGLVDLSDYFKVGDEILLGKYKTSKGKIVGFGQDKWGNPTVEVEPIPKGRKKNKVIGLFKIWHASIRDQEGE